MPPVLALYEDVFPNDATLALPALPRMIFVVHGGITVADRGWGDGESWHGGGAAMLAAGTGGATCWRFELAPVAGTDSVKAGVSSRMKLSARLDPFPAGGALVRRPSGRVHTR